MASNETLNWYANYFKNWQVKTLGPKPTAEMFEAVHGLGLRPGKQALANAMALRAEGVTNAQIIMACGNPQLNRMRGLIADKLVKRVPTPQTNEGHTVYRLELTAKGNDRIARASKVAAQAEADGKGAADKPAKPAKRPSKAKGAAKAKGKADTAKPETLTSEADKPVEGIPEVTATVEPVTADQPQA